MAKYIDKAAVVAELERLSAYIDSLHEQRIIEKILSILDKLEVKEVVLNSIVYVITRCEEHSDYVEEVFIDKDKAQEYCDQFNGNEDEYARHITKVKVTL